MCPHFFQDISFKANFLDNPQGEPPIDEPYPVQPAVSAPIYVTLILYDKTNGVWVSMIPTTELFDAWGGARMVFSAPDENGWRAATPVGSSVALWTAWTFEGNPWLATEFFPWGAPIPQLMKLPEWDAYTAALGLDVKVRKVNIQFGYRPPVVHQDWDGDGIPEAHDLGVSYGTVYVDGLSFGGRTLDFEP